MMILAGLLIVYATVVGTVGQRPLTRLTSKTRSPLFGAATWLLACASVILAWLGASLLAAGWHLPAFAAALVDRCLTTAERPHDHVHLTAPAVALPALAASTLRATWVTVRGYCADARFRREHVRAARLVGSANRDLGVIVVDAAEPAAYSLAGPRPTIIVTTCAVRKLSSAALAAALDHERCHLAERHFLLLGAAGLTAKAFPFVPLFRAAAARVGDLVEMRADDVAARRHGAGSVADAIAAITSALPDPAPAANEQALARVARLLGTVNPRGERWLLSLITMTLSLGPAAVLLLPFCN